MFTRPIFTRSFNNRTVKVMQGLLALVFMLSLIGMQPAKPVQAATTVNLPSTGDTYLRQGYATRNYGGSVTVSVSNSSSGQNSLYKWDLSSIQPNSTVTAASISFYVTDTSAQDFSLFNMRRGWVEGTSNDAASSTSANWNTYNGVDTWGTAGAKNTSTDRYNTDLWDATGGAGGTFSSSGNVTIPLNTSGISAVQEWINTPANNFGVTVQFVGTTGTADYWIVASKENSSGYAVPTLNVTFDAAGPTITTTGTLTAFGTPVGTPSEVQTYTVSGVNLTANIDIGGVSGFETSLDGISWVDPFSSYISLPQTGGIVSPTTIYVRMTGAELGNYSGNLSHVSSGAADKTVAVTGTVYNVYTLTAGNDGHGTVTLAPAGGSYPSGTTVTLTPVPATGYAFDSWSGTDVLDIINTSGVYTIVMNGDKTVTANFVVSLCTDVSLEATKDTYLSGAQTTNNYGAQTYMRVTLGTSQQRASLLQFDLSAIPAEATVESASLSLNVSTAGAATYNLYAMRQAWVEGTGTGSATGDGATWQTYNGSNNWGTSGAASTTTDRYDTNLWGAGSSTFSTGGIKEVDLDADGLAVVQGWVAGSLTNNGLTIQNYTSGSTDVQFSTRNNTTEANWPRLNINYCVAPSGPTITTTGTLAPFSTPMGTPSAAQTYTVSGSLLTNDITISAPGGFEIKAEGGTYGELVTLIQTAGTVPATTIYVRMTGTDHGDFGGNLAHVSSGASNKNIAITGSVYYEYTLVVGNDGRGSVTLNPLGGTYREGTTVTLTPVPNSGFAFDSWSGANAGQVINTSGIYTIVMNGNKALDANFIPAQSCSTVNLVAAEDTYMSSFNTTYNYGGVNLFKVTNNNNGNNRGALLRWDLDSLPDDAIVSGASLKINVSTASTQAYNLYKMQQDWVEGTLTTGAASTTSANWETYDGVNDWGAPGAASTTVDRYDTNLWSTTTSTFTPAGSKTIALNSDGIAAVQSWITSPANNFGVTMQSYSSTSGNDDLQISSSENSTSANRPTLIVDYCVPSSSVTLTVGNDGNGSVTLNPAGGTYDYGTLVTLTPVPTSGYVFATWSGADAEDPTDNGDGTWSITMDGNKSIMANFSLIPVNVPPNQPVLVQPADDATGVTLPPTLQVTASDPNTAGTLDVSFYGRAAGTTTPAEDFTLIVIPDTQNHSAAVFNSMLQWIASNKTTQNIVFATSMGDIVNTSSSSAEYTKADTAYDYLDTGSVAYSVGPGNHDIAMGTTLYPTYFGNSRFLSKPSYQGYYTSGGDNYNNYSFFSASGMDFILINLQYNPTTAMLDWADALLKANPSKRGIVEQHNILNVDNSWVDGGVTYTALKDNPNLFLILCGHMHTSTDGSAYRAELGTDGHTIHILMTDYQDYNNSTNTGYLRILRFSPANDKIYSQVYSPYVPTYLTNISNYEQFEMVYDLAGGTAAAFTLIGTAEDVANGANASVSWSGLAASTEYEWYATVSDGEYTTTGSTWSFTTGTGTSNQPPVITEGTSVAVTMSEDGAPTAFSLTLNATDVDSSTLTWSISTPATNGTASASGTGLTKAIGYTPTANYNGTDSFVVQVSDGSLNDTIMVNVTIQAVNDAPVITEGTSVSVTMSEDGAPTAFALTLNTTDVDHAGSALTWSISSPATNGTASASGTGLSKAIGYIPTANYNGTDSFVVQVSDGSLSDTITVNVTIQAVNDAPVITEGTSVSVTMSEDGAPTAFSLTLNATDVDHGGSALTWSISTPAGSGTASASGTGLSKAIGYIPTANYNGSDSFVVRVSDGSLNDTITVNVTIQAVNDAPINSVPGAQTTLEDTALVFNSSRLISVSDLDVSEDVNGKLQVNISVSHGTFTLSQITNLTFTSGDGVGDASMTFSGVPSFVNAALNNLVYQPAANYNGSDTLQIVTSDLGNTGSGGVQTDTDIVSINITAVNTAPVITEGTSVAVTMSEDGAPTAFSLTLNATDVDSPTLTWSISTPAASGTASASGTGLSKAIAYTPTADFNGTDSFAVQVSDGSLSDTITVNVTIQAVNDAPVAVDDTFSMIKNTVLEISSTLLIENDNDIENSVLSVTGVSNPTNGIVGLASGTITFTPTTDFTGTAGFDYTLSDGDLTDTGHVTVIVNEQTVPNLPSSFWGKIYYQAGDGVPAVGDYIEAYVPGVSAYVVRAAITKPGADLVYAINVPSDNVGTSTKDGGLENDVVTFKINGRIVGTAVWHTGTNVELDFHPPKADAGGPYVGLVNTAIALTGSASDWGSDVSAWAWDLDNDLAYDDSVLQNASVTFTTIGKKIVSLKVTDLQQGVGSDPSDVVVISLGGLSGQIYDGTAKPVTVSGVESPYTYLVKYDGSTTAPSAAGSYPVVVEIKQGETLVGTISGNTLVISPASQTITVDTHAPTTAAYGSSFTVAASASSGLPVTYSSGSTGVCTVSGATFTMVSGTGTCVVRYDQAGNANYSAAPQVIEDVTAQKASQTITVTTHAPATAAFGSSFTVAASASSGLLVTYSSGDTDVCTADGATFTMVSASGTCVVRYDQAGNTNYSAAPQVTENVAAQKASQTITVTTHAPATAAYGSSFTVAASASSGQTVTYSSGSTDVCTVSGATFTMVSGTGTCVVQYDQAGNANYSAAPQVTDIVTAQKKTASVTPAVASKVYGNDDPTFSGTLSGFLAADGVTAIYARTSGETVAGGPYTISATLSPTGVLANYDITYNTAAFTISLRPITVTADNKEKAVGTIDPPLTYQVTVGSLAFTDTFSGALARVSGETVGTYPILKGNLALNSNYTLTFVEGTFSIVDLNYASIDLVAGWNLVSFTIHPDTTAIASVLSDISGKYNLVYAWDASGGHSGAGNWMKYDPAQPFGNTLTTLDEMQGFWIFMTEPDTLDVYGTFPTTTNIPLRDDVGGWNLVGYPSMSSQTLPGALESHGVTLYSLVYTYHANDTADPWKLFDPTAAPFASDLKSMAPGWGYWIYVTADATWQVAY